MKLITREDFRVDISGQVVIKTMPYGTPALTDLVERIDLKGTVYPRRLGDFGSFSISDNALPGKNRDIAGEYERRCKEIVYALHEQYGYQVKAEIACTTTETCSHCGYGWTELDEDDVKASPELVDEPHAGLGMPWCCEAAQVEWRAAQTTAPTPTEATAVPAVTA